MVYIATRTGKFDQTFPQCQPTGTTVHNRPFAAHFPGECTTPLQNIQHSQVWLHSTITLPLRERVT